MSKIVYRLPDNAHTHISLSDISPRWLFILGFYFILQLATFVYFYYQMSQFISIFNIQNGINQNIIDFNRDQVEINQKLIELYETSESGSSIQESIPPVMAKPPISLIIHGRVSWYGTADNECLGCSANRRMANGNTFDETAYTAACSDPWPLGTIFRVRYLANEVTVVCTDRGGFQAEGISLDLSKAAFTALAPLSKGIISVSIQEVK